MIQSPPIISHDLLLVGAGHAQVAVIKRLAMDPVPGLRCVLISDDRRTPYSGMLPGAISGFYTEDDLYIDLDRLCACAGVEFIQGRVTALDPVEKTVTLSNGVVVQADSISINPGGAPLSPWRGPSAQPDWLLLAKPIGRFWQSWTRWIAKQTAKSNPNVLIVGAGAAGVELAFSVDAALARVCHDHSVALVGSSQQPLPDLGRRAGASVKRQFDRRGISYLSGQRASLTESGSMVGEEAFDADLVIWAAGVAAPGWLAESGLACDDGGFAQIDATLQSTSHPGIFLAGDAVSFTPKPLPKAGVYSVRMGPILAQNVVSRALGHELQKYKPQANTLFLLGDGQGSAMAWYAGFSVWGQWVWRWKDQIDQAFMDRFGKEMQAAHKTMLDQQATASGEAMRCTGCAAKVASVGLHTALGQVGVTGGDDAAALGDGWLQSVDAISAPFADPYQHGYIAVLHALSDLYVSGQIADGCVPQLAVQITVQAGKPANEAARLSVLLQGVRNAAMAEGANIATGHSSSGAQDQVCITVTGKIEPTTVEPWNGEALGIILSKPLGVGVLLAARAQGQPIARAMAEAVEVMRQSNRGSAQALWQMGALAMTDVTGFGLVNHLSTILPFQAKARLTVKTLPKLPMAHELAKTGVRSSAFLGNAISAGFVPEQLSAAETLCFDPQTSGGVAALVPMKDCNNLPDGLWLAGVVTHSADDTIPSITLV